MAPFLTDVPQTGEGIIYECARVRERGAETIRALPQNRNRRRESAPIVCLESKQVRRLTSAATRVHGRGAGRFGMAAADGAQSREIFYSSVRGTGSGVRR